MKTESYDTQVQAFDLVAGDNGKSKRVIRKKVNPESGREETEFSHKLSMSVEIPSEREELDAFIDSFGGGFTGFMKHFTDGYKVNRQAVERGYVQNNIDQFRDMSNTETAELVKAHVDATDWSKTGNRQRLSDDEKLSRLLGGKSQEEKLAILRKAGIIE